MTLMQYNIDHLIRDRGVEMDKFRNEDHMLYKLMLLIEHELGWMNKVFE